MYPHVTSWTSDSDRKQAVSLLGEMVSLQVKDFANARAVCVNDVLVNGPPVWRVSVTFWNETDTNGDGIPDYPTDVKFEIELAAERNDTADERDWVSTAASMATYSADYNRFRGTCPVTPRKILRRRAEGAMGANSTAARVHTVGNTNDSVSFTFVSLGEPFDKPTFLPEDPYLNEVRACARHSRSSGSTLLRRFLVAGVQRARSCGCGCGRPWSSKRTSLERTKYSAYSPQNLRAVRGTSAFCFTNSSRSTSPCLRTAKRSRSESRSCGRKAKMAKRGPASPLSMPTARSQSKRTSCATRKRC